MGAGIVDPFAALTAQTTAGPSSSAAAAAAPGRVRVLPGPDQSAGLAQRWGRLLGIAGALTVAAILAYLGRLALRAARRRRTRPGPSGREAAREPVIEPPDVRLI